MDYDEDIISTLPVTGRLPVSLVSLVSQSRRGAVELQAQKKSALREWECLTASVMDRRLLLILQSAPVSEDYLLKVRFIFRIAFDILSNR